MLQNVFLSGVLYPRTICGHGIFRNMSDQIRSAQSYQSWDTRTPVKIRLNEDKSQIDGRTPISVQTMFKTKVEQFWSKNAMGIKRNGIEWNRWTYEQYYLETRAAAKG